MAWVSLHSSGKLQMNDIWKTKVATAREKLSTSADIVKICYIRYCKDINSFAMFLPNLAPPEKTIKENAIGQGDPLLAPRKKAALFDEFLWPWYQGTSAHRGTLQFWCSVGSDLLFRICVQICSIYLIHWRMWLYSLSPCRNISQVNWQITTKRIGIFSCHHTSVARGSILT